jgi:hypothetical protein
VQTSHGSVRQPMTKRYGNCSVDSKSWFLILNLLAQITNIAHASAHVGRSLPTKLVAPPISGPF